ncbi:unnamed protein product [Cylindrotheca closterium]|uniref:Uncharacterized protein n=1 Tax=Cylindrotheca closterium TaxID=2856 RepID=A0AAD2CH31_9STRA|nr:unnamed protein product [Cylindrotheca closterium]
MPPQARFEGVVEEEPSPLSERTNPSIRKVPARFLLVEDPMKAPMNPEEVHLMRRGERMMKQPKNQTKDSPINFRGQAKSFKDQKKKKKFTNNFFQNIGKSGFRILPIPKKE